MVNKSILRRKLSLIEEHIKRIKSLPSLTYEEFLKDNFVQDVFLFNITQAIQKCVDIAVHIVSDEGWGIPGTQIEAFEILYKRGIISAEWFEKFKKMIGFRNRVIHEYEGLNLKIVYEVYQKGIRDIKEFCLLIIEKYGL